MAIIPLGCPHCHGCNLSKFGKTRTGKQRYACNNPECSYHTFTLEPHAYPGRRQEVKAQIADMAINGSGVRDTLYRKDTSLCVRYATFLEVFLQLKKLLEPFGIKKFYTDGLKTYEHTSDSGNAASE